jgi:hypothetical protein
MTPGIHLRQNDLILTKPWGHIKGQKLMNITFSITGRPLTPNMAPRGHKCKTECQIIGQSPIDFLPIVSTAKGQKVYYIVKIYYYT